MSRVANFQRRIVEAGCDLDLHNAGGTTALCYCAQENFLDTARYLIEKGADFNKRNKLGQTALWVACNSGNKCSVLDCIQ